jgi:hypothetical protein
MKKGSIAGFIRGAACRACLAAGVGLLLSGLAIGIYTGIFLHRSVTANGRIVNLRELHDQQDGSLYYAPVFTFAASNGQIYTVSSDTGSNPPGFELGQPVKIMYEERQPSQAKIASFMQLWFNPLMFGFVGATSSVIGYLLYRYERQRNPGFKLIPSLAPAPAKPELKEYLLGDPKVDDFTVERDPDPGRPVTL